MSKNLESLVEDLSALTVLEMSELKSKLEDKWGVQAAAAAAVVAAPAAGGEAQAAEESTDFMVTLESAPADKKIAVIKVVREITEMGLKEAKDLVDGAPKVVKEGVKKEEAEAIKAKIEEAGGKVTLK